MTTTSPGPSQNGWLMPEQSAFGSLHAWHDEMNRWEQDLLNQHILRFRVFQVLELEDTPAANLLSTSI
jgi:hypothetical protein